MLSTIRWTASKHYTIRGSDIVYMPYHLHDSCIGHSISAKGIRVCSFSWQGDVVDCTVAIVPSGDTFQSSTWPMSCLVETVPTISYGCDLPKGINVLQQYCSKQMRRGSQIQPVCPLHTVCVRTSVNLKLGLAVKHVYVLQAELNQSASSATSTFTALSFTCIE